jgi:predicted RNase H-like HicB family nuclease
MKEISVMHKMIKKYEEYLKEPYSRVLIPDEESETYTALILEFPGCIAQGDTPQEAYEHLEDAAKGWIEAALDLKQRIPSPSQSLSFGGKVLLRLPKSLHRQSTLIAEKEGVSLNQFILSALSEKVGAFNLYDKLSNKLDQRFHIAINTAVTTLMTDYATEVSSKRWLNKSLDFSKEAQSNAGNKEYNIYPQRSGGGFDTLQ